MHGCSMPNSVSDNTVVTYLNRKKQVINLKLIPREALLATKDFLITER